MAGNPLSDLDGAARIHVFGDARRTETVTTNSFQDPAGLFRRKKSKAVIRVESNVIRLWFTLTVKFSENHEHDSRLRPAPRPPGPDPDQTDRPRYRRRRRRRD